MRDSAVTGVIAGISGGIVYQFAVWFFYLFGIAKVTPFMLGAYVLISPGLDISSPPAQALGMVQHFANSSLLGLISVYLLRFMGTDYLLIKGLAYGAVLYFLLYGVIAKSVIPVNILQPDLQTSAVFLLGNILFGVITIHVAGYLVRNAKRI